MQPREIPCWNIARKPTMGLFPPFHITTGFPNATNETPEETDVTYAYFTFTKPSFAAQCKVGGLGKLWLKLYKLLYSMLWHDIKDPPHTHSFHHPLLLRKCLQERLFPDTFCQEFSLWFSTQDICEGQNVWLLYFWTEMDLNSFYICLEFKMTFSLENDWKQK